MVNHWVSFLSILFLYTNCGAGSIRDQKFSLYYLKSAIDLTEKAKYNFPSGFNCENNLSRNALDCSELLEMGYKKNGVYTIWPKSRVVGGKNLELYCDMETDGGGWTVIQRRGSFGRAVDYFYKDWKSYKEGFGDLGKEFWLGDSMAENHNNQKFSAKGQKNDSNKNENCVESYKGGWWHHSCHEANLNGLNLKGKHESWANGINWKSWKGYQESLQETEIKIRPRNFKLPHASLNNTPM